MTDDGSKTRPVRTLTVENFSVVREAKLEFGKITVLIGPQSSGKSLLCKLAYFLGKELVELAVTSLLSGNSWSEYLRDASKAFWSRFASGDGLVSRGTKISLSSYQYEITLAWEVNPSLPIFSFSRNFQQQYEFLRNSPRQSVPSASGAFIPGGTTSMTRRGEVWIALNQILSGSVLDGAIYVPAGRAFFTNTSKGFAILQNVGIDSITREFAAQIQWDSRWKIGLMTSGRGVTDEISRSMTEIMKGFVMMDAGVPRFIASDGRRLPMEVLSTGVQEMVPLFNILDQLMFLREQSVELARAYHDPPHPEQPVASRPLLYLEEPEANVFPKTQYELVQLIAWFASDPIFDFSWVITTHSPYILTAFNDLIKAGHVATERPDKASEIEKIIRRQYWIKPRDFVAYAFDGKDGILRSIMDEETKLINGDVLDDISETISGEFGQLLEIQYGD
jgi:hypothetical protein